MEWCISDRLKEGCGMELTVFQGTPGGAGQEDGRLEVSLGELGAVVMDAKSMCSRGFPPGEVFYICLEEFNQGFAADTVR